MPRNNARLSPPEVNFIIKMKEVKYSNREIARRMGIIIGIQWRGPRQNI